MGTPLRLAAPFRLWSPSQTHHWRLVKPDTQVVVAQVIRSSKIMGKLKIRTSKTSVLCETSSKTKDPNFQNECFLRDFHENGNTFWKYCDCHDITTRGHIKCCTGHANCSSSSSFKNITLLRNRALRSQNIASMVRIPCACHVKQEDLWKVSVFILWFFHVVEWYF